MIHDIEPIELLAIYSQLSNKKNEFKWDYDKYMSIAHKVEETYFSIRIINSYKAYLQFEESYQCLYKWSNGATKCFKSIDEIRKITSPYYPAERIAEKIKKVIESNEKDS